MIGNNLKQKAGFTLVELIVAVGVFAAVVVAVSTIFTSVVNSQRKNVNNEEILDNARFVLENMARAIRQSCVINDQGIQSKSCIVSPDGSSSSLNVLHPTKGVVVYNLSNGHITEKSNTDSSAINLTSDSVAVDSLTFVVAGNNITDNIQPRITISISMRSVNQNPGTDTNINLQTTVTPRTLQIQ